MINNILHIEDSMADAHLIKKLMNGKRQQAHIYNITHVTNMKDACKRLHDYQGYSAILLDLNLPDGSGVENITSLQSINSETPIIVVTGTDDDVIANDVLNHGAQEYVVKAHLTAQTIKQTIKSSICRKKAQLDLLRQVRHDSLTNLPNRDYFEHVASVMMRRDQRSHNKGALMFIDLNDFKEINDKHGHEAGNVVLKETAKRLRGVLRESDVLARYAGDEFVAYLDSGQNPITEEFGQHIAQKILSITKKPIQISGCSVAVGLSIGIAIYPDAGATFDALLKSADRAMYIAKNNPSKHYVIIGEKAYSKNYGRIFKATIEGITVNGSRLANC